uniref:Glycine-rich RNA-binding protein 6 n=1 Tax=Rhizophora mucronata TaxID=61149 RepID=A0A2P2QRP2_RHIMU
MALASSFRRLVNGSASSVSSILQQQLSPIRWYTTLTSPKLFVSGLSRLTTDEKLKDTFAAFGQLVEAKIITDRASGRSRGFAFVTYTTIEEAEKAREAMNAKMLDGWVIFVDPAKPRERRPPPETDPEQLETGLRTNKTVGWRG